MSNLEESGDIKIWCKECEKSDYNIIGDKYVCRSCGKSLDLDHEVHHEIFPHVVGDSDNLS